MTAFVSKLQDTFSDWMLDLELFVTRFKSQPKSVKEPVIPVEEHIDEPVVNTAVTPTAPVTPITPISTAPVTPIATTITAPTPDKVKMEHMNFKPADVLEREAKKGPELDLPIPKPPAEALAKAKALHGGHIHTVNKEKVDVKDIKIPLRLRILRISRKDLLTFYDQMATLLNSEVTLIDALILIKAQTKLKSVKKLYAEIIHQINSGLSLAESMGLFPHIFPKMQASLVAAGEKSGNMKTVFNELSESLEADQEFLRKITGAMFYPVILMVMCIGLVVGMMTFVIPKIAGMYEDSNTALPKPTQMIIDLSDFIVTEWQSLLIIGFGSIFFGYVLFAKLRFGKFLWEKIISIIPVAGRISKQKNLMMFASNMHMLLKSGVLIADAFAITTKTVGNLHYQREIKRIRHGIVMGKEVSEMMGLIDIKAEKFKKNKFFPLEVAQMIHIGEQTGHISDMFLKIKQNYHKSIDFTLKNISTVIEPIMIFFLAAIVGGVLMAVMLPFFYIGTTIN